MGVPSISPSIVAQGIVDQYRMAMSLPRESCGTE